MPTDEQRWTVRPEGSNWGDFGEDDQIGRLNLVTPAVRRAAAAEVREGIAFCLSLPLDYPGGAVINPRRHPPELRPTMREGRANMALPLRCYDPTALDIICDDQVLLTLQYSTQWDTLAHVGQMFDVNGDGEPEDVFYNGFRAGSDVAGPVLYRGGQELPNEAPQGARRLGVENMAKSCIQGRGVMIDLEAHFGRSGEIVGYEQLMRVLEKDGVVVEPGDLVCLRTGFAEMLLAMNKQPDAELLRTTNCALDGRDERLLQWITDTRLVALISDNYAVEAAPAKPCTADVCSTLPLHAHCLFRLGVYLGAAFFVARAQARIRSSSSSSLSRALVSAPSSRSDARSRLSRCRCTIRSSMLSCMIRR